MKDWKEGREIFRWLGKDVLYCFPFFFLVTSHPPFSLSVCLFPIFSVRSFCSLSSFRSLDNNNNEDNDDGNDDRSVNGIKGKSTRGIQKALKISLYFVAGFIRSLARVKVINHRIPSCHFTPLFLFPLSSSPRYCSFREASLSKLKFLVFE